MPDQSKLTSAPRRTLPVFYVLDTSGSMMGAPIEQLNRAETNMINSLGEGADLVAAADHPRVRLLADYYHISAENQPVEDILRLGGIAHAHIATREGRRVPTSEDAGYARMFAAMKRTGYRGMLSIEGKTDDLAADGPAAVRVLRKMWEEA